MQSGYGVPEIQQFMVDTCCSSLLSMGHDIGSSSQAQKHQQNQHPQYHHQHQEHQHHQQQRFHHFQPIPITQQFFHHHHQQFQAFQQQQTRRLHQQLGLEQESVTENSNSTSRIVGAGGSPFIATNFKLGVNENSGSREGINDEDTIMRSEDGSDSRAAVAVHRWQQQQREQDSAIKEPFWKPLDIEYTNRNNKRCKEKLETSNKYSKKPDEENENEEGKSSGSNYGLFSELEAIYTLSSGGNNQTGSGSALTGDNNPPAAAAVPGPAGYPQNNIDHGSETSTGEEASLRKLQKTKKKRKKKQLISIATFFENLVKQLMDHQESLHRKFLEVMERRDQERTNREEAWRRQESAKSNSEAIVRAHEQALASSREAAIVSFLEKITGETIKLPEKEQFEDIQKEQSPIERSETLNNTDNVDSANTRRWPKAEVQALIRVRSGLESRFQEPGLKGPLWEEVSTTMVSMGYQRSAKRCKEKWENINKYFRKTKDSAKKRPQHSKTCPYFHQLDQLYSKSRSLTPKPAATDIEPKDNSELLDAIVVPVDQNIQQNPSLEFIQEQLEMQRNFKFPELGPLRSTYSDNDNSNDASSITARKILLQLRQEDEHDDEEDEDKEGEGENQEQLQDHGREIEHKEDHRRDAMSFHLES